MANIQHKVVDIDGGPGQEEHQADEDHHQVGFLSLCQFLVHNGCVSQGYHGDVGREGSADLGVDDDQPQTRDQQLEGEAGDGVGQVVGVIRPVLAKHSLY